MSAAQPQSAQHSSLFKVQFPNQGIEGSAARGQVLATGKEATAVQHGDIVLFGPSVDFEADGLVVRAGKRRVVRVRLS